MKRAASHNTAFVVDDIHRHFTEFGEKVVTWQPSSGNLSNLGTVYVPTIQEGDKPYQRAGRAISLSRIKGILKFDTIFRPDLVTSYMWDQTLRVAVVYDRQPVGTTAASTIFFGYGTTGATYFNILSGANPAQSQRFDILSDEFYSITSGFYPTEIVEVLGTGVTENAHYVNRTLLVPIDIEFPDGCLQTYENGTSDVAQGGIYIVCWPYYDDLTTNTSLDGISQVQIHFRDLGID